MLLLLTQHAGIGSNTTFMAKPLVLAFGGVEIPLALAKVERSDLYGFVDVETLDEKGRKCVLTTLAEDGKSIIPPGGTAFASLSPEGNWLEKRSLIPTDTQGNRIAPVASSYAAPVRLEKSASIEEYLSHDIRAVYQISSEGNWGALLDELKKGTIYTFPYSFRGGLEPDAGFLLVAADGTPFLAVGSPTQLEFVGLEQSAAVAEEEEVAGEGDESIDFGMM
jgi:hypothetical protein